MNNNRKLHNRLKDIIEAAGQIDKFTNSISKADFLNDAKTQSAVIYKLTVIGEASRQIQKHYSDFIKKNSHIPWIDISDFRNRMIHGYTEVDLNIVWNISKNELPGLKKDIQKLYNGISQNN